MSQPSDHPLHALFAPKSIAVVGASPKGGYGLTTIDNLRALQFPGRIDVIHPRFADVAGLPAVARLSDLDHVPDAVAVAVPAHSVAAVLGEAAGLGVRAGVVYASGFAELGTAGAALQSSMAAACGPDLRVVGPNCLGVISYRHRSALWGIGMPFGHAGGAGVLALAAQSGNMALTLLSTDRLPPVAYAVSAGNQAVLDVTDCFDYFLADPQVRVVALIIEGLADPRRFRRLAAVAADRGIGVVVLKVGRSAMGERATVAHTGTLAGRDASYDAMFAQTGVIRVHDLDELVAVSTLLAADRPLRGPRLGVFASSGGECGLIADVAEDTGVGLPDLEDEVVASLGELIPSYGSVRNPFDLTAGGWGQFDIYAAAATALGRSPSVDIVAFVGDNSTTAGDPNDVGWDAMTGGAGKAAADLDVPVALITTTTDTSPQLVEMARAEGLLVLTGLRPALRAIGLVGASAVGPTPGGAPGSGGGPVGVGRIMNGFTGSLTEGAAKGVLSTYGIEVPLGETVTDRAAAVDVAERLGFPVVMKIGSSDVAHKSDVGGVLLDLRDATSVAAGFDQLSRVMGTPAPADAPPIRVEQMIGYEGVEMIIGGHNDAVGSLVVIGAGGVLTELLADAGGLLWPFDEADVRRTLESLRCNKLLQGFRGKPPVDVAALAECAVAVGRLLAENPAIAEIDVNPVLVRRNGAIALDALIVMNPSSPTEG